MESLYLLIPLSIVLVLTIGGLLVWAVMSGQFDDLDAEGRRILEDDDSAPARTSQESRKRPSAREGQRGI